MLRAAPLVLALLALAPTAQALDPLLTPGARWAVDTTVGDRLVAREVAQVALLETIEDAEGRPVQVARVHQLTVFPSDGSLGIRETNTTVWLRASDGAFVRSESTTTLQDGSTQRFGELAHEPCRFLRPDPEWEIDCASTIADDAGQTRHAQTRLHYREVSRGEQDTPVGRHLARVVEVREGGPEGNVTARLTLSDGLCTPLLTETLDGSNVTSRATLVLSECPRAAATPTPGGLTPSTTPCGRFNALRCTPGVETPLVLGVLALAGLAAAGRKRS